MIFNMNKIIAVVGMCGSGKSVLCDYLVKKGFQCVYFGGVTIDLLKKEGLPITPENEKEKREALRKKYGMGAYAIVLLPEIKEALKKGNVVLDGLYSWDEYKILYDEFKNNIIMVSLIVDKEIRYSRLSKRNVRPFNNIDAQKRDVSEIENLSKGGPIVYADYFIDNNKDINNIFTTMDEILKKIEGSKNE